MSKVVLDRLVKIYPDKRGPGVRAVNAIDLDVCEGEFMVLVGPSGCGKSTTLRMIAGLEEITSGTVSIGGKVVNNVPPKDRDIAMVFQNYALYPHMTVHENMAFGLKLRRFPRQEIDGRVSEAAAILGIESLLPRKPRALSGGQRQRVAVGRAIVRQPKVFLFDEPLSNLDAKMRVSMRAEISRLHAQLNATMIYVTHDQVEAMTMGDRICVMKDGDIMQVAEPIELYHRPANLFVAGFIGSPPMNVMSGWLKRAGAHLKFVEQTSSGEGVEVTLDEALSRRASAYVDKPVVFGIRPEDAAIATAGSDPARSIEARIEAAETMGHETHLHLSTGSHLIVARVRGTEAFERGRQVRIELDVGKASVFDPGTERAVR